MADRWLVAVDRDSGDMYFFNERTKETTWELPEGVYPGGLAVIRDMDDDDLDADDTVPNRPFAREGFLLKAPPGQGKWRKRWLVADRVTRVITWYAANPRAAMAKYKVTEPIKGSLSLVGARVFRNRAELPQGTKLATGAPPSAHEFFVVTSGRTLQLCAQSASDADGWFNYLQRAVDGHSSHGGAKVRTSTSAARATIAAAARSQQKPRLLRSPIEVGAWVHKLAPDGHRWEKRWATLKPGSMVFAYYTGPDPGARCCRVVDLRAATLQAGCADVMDPSADVTLLRSPGFRLLVHGVGADSEEGGRQLVFVTPDLHESQTWIDAIHTAQEIGGASAGVSIGGGHKAAGGDAASSSSSSSSSSAAAATAGATTRADLPVEEGKVFKANPAGTKWAPRTLVLVPHESKVDAAPGLRLADCPAIAYYSVGDKSGGPRGLIPLTEVTGVVMSAPEKVRRGAPAPFTLTVHTQERDFYFAAYDDADLVRWREAIFRVAELWNAED